MHDALERFARDFPAGTVLFEEGQPAGDMYIVVSGEVEILRQVGNAARVLAVLAAGEFFGEMAILNGRPRSATAVARTAARLLVIDATTFEAMLRARPEIALRMIRALASRLDSANHHVELLLLPTANHRVAQCLRHMAEEQMRAGSPPGDRAAPWQGTERASRSEPLEEGDDDGLVGHGTEILVPASAGDIAERVGLPVAEVEDVLVRLRAASLVLTPQDAGIEGDGFLVPEVGRLLEFLEFLNLKNRFGE